MSKLKLESDVSGTGTVTLKAPNTDTDYTLNLPTGDFVSSDASGNVGIGTSNPSYPLDVTGDISSKYSSGTNRIILGADSGSAYVIANNAVDMKFTTDGAERMRIDSSGLVTMNGATAAGHLSIDTDLSQRAALTLKTNTNSYASGIVTFKNYSGSNVGYISITSTSTTYNTSSDYRLKTDVQPMTNATYRLKQLKPVNFEWISSGERVDGFLAHELQAVIPEAATGTKDEVDDEGKPVYQGIDQSKIVPLLVATIQELEARITALEAQP